MESHTDAIVDVYDGLATNDSDAKKRKKYRDITIELVISKRHVLIRDKIDDNDENDSDTLKHRKSLYNNTLDEKRFNILMSGDEITLIGSLKCQLGDKVKTAHTAIQSKEDSIEPTLKFKKFKNDNASLTKPFRAPESSSSSSLSTSEANASLKPSKAPSIDYKDQPSSATPVIKLSEYILDPLITRKMNAHQITGAQFLLDRMISTPIILQQATDSISNNEIEDRNDDNDDDDDDDDDEKASLSSDDSFIDVPKSPKNSMMKTVVNPSGAILADEMGLGKTLTSLCVLWSICNNKTRKSRGVIVVPASLVDNWSKEVHKWIGPTCNLLVFRAGSDLSRVVSALNADVKFNTKILIISYGMFQKHVVELQKIARLDLIICDEGHKLKNAKGNLITSALKQFKAKMRMLLTGTPIQNNYDELFAIVSCVAPNYLGTYRAFKHNFIDAILSANATNATQYDLDIADKQAARLKEMLSKIMIRRTQNEILRKLLPERNDYILYCNMTKKQEDRYNEIAKELVDVDAIVADVTADEAIEDNRSSDKGNGSMIISDLQILRQICNSSTTTTATATTTTSNSSVTSATRTTTAMNDELQTLYDNSAKIQVLDNMLSYINEQHPADKVVVVCNSIVMLDRIQELSIIKSWSFLRLDGKTTIDIRQNLVDAFNRDSDNHFLMLLSSKAGGVGLNLIGGNRLIMVDADWNPALDKQAMARIWRQGQKKPVFVYRLITQCKIEEAILCRQFYKSTLADSILIKDDVNADDTGDSNKLHFSLTNRDINQLLYPSTAMNEMVLLDEAAVTDANAGTDGDDVCKHIMSILGTAVGTCILGKVCKNNLV